MAARQRVLNTTEILEQVLLHVDIKTLVTSGQRVCSLWHQLITTSPSLQEHLFLRPASKPVPEAINPLLAAKFPHWFPHKTGESGDPFTPFQPESLEAYDLAREDANAAYKYEQASWRRMLPRQPPIWIFTRCTFRHGRFGNYTCFSTVAQTGVTDITEEQVGDTTGDEPKDANADTDVDSEPLRMECLYHLITGGYGTCHSWLFVWNGHHDKIVNIEEPPVEAPVTEQPATKQPSKLKSWLQARMSRRPSFPRRTVPLLTPVRTETGPFPAEINSQSISSELSERLQLVMRRDGLVLLECGTDQCTGEGPSRFKEKFWMTEYWKLRRAEQYGW